MAEKAKVPAIAGGAALAGLAGGMALKGRKRGGISGMASRMPKPSMPSVSLPKPNGSLANVVGGAAKELAKGSYKLGQLTSEVQKVREALDSKDSK